MQDPWQELNPDRLTVTVIDACVTAHRAKLYLLVRAGSSDETAKGLRQQADDGELCHV
jgi:hypothetical protein